MFTKTYKVFGVDGHRQRISFGTSTSWDFSKNENVRKIEVDCSDKTGTNDYVIVRITRNTEHECDAEFDGQLIDGLFENSRCGRVEVF